MPKRYQVVDYSVESLVALFFKGAYNHRESYVRGKAQIRYLVDYCASIGTKTLVYEPEYIDVHFSIDHSGYYARCFELYPKTCSRIHFFDVHFTERTLANVLSGKGRCAPAQFSMEFGYRGFIVVKPLPETIVGRTCLVAPNGPTENNFPTLHGYTANLFGIPLTVNSLPFQEQDHEVAACATSALWSVVHGTARVFQHAVFSPLEITRTALATLPLFGRALPNDGLTVYQMAGVIRQFGLEADLVDVNKKYLLQSSSYAYLRGGVPPLLGFDFNLDDPDHPPQLHAVAVVGYELNGPVIPFELNEFRLRATRLTKLFTHDDGVGPFAPCSLTDDDLVLTEWEDDRGDKKKARPSQLLIPLYQQIRTPFNGILDSVIELDDLVEGLRSDLKTLDLSERLEWDIYLIEVQRFKREILADPKVSQKEKLDILTRNLPRFLWRATGYETQERKLDVVFDATDLLQGRQLVTSITHASELEIKLASECQRIGAFEYLEYELSKNIVNHFLDKYQQKASG